jgi:hypothetical protein
MQTMCRGDRTPAPDPRDVEVTTFLPVLDDILLAGLDTGDVDTAAMTAPPAAAVPTTLEIDDDPTQRLFGLLIGGLPESLPAPIPPPMPTAPLPVSSEVETNRPGLVADLLDDGSTNADEPTAPVAYHPWFNPDPNSDVSWPDDLPDEDPALARPRLLERVNRHGINPRDPELLELILKRLHEL